MHNLSGACLVIQPIHPVGLETLQRGGLTIRHSRRGEPREVVAEATDCVAVVTRNAGFSAEAINAAAALKVIGVHGIGVDPVAVPVATAHGIAVVNTPLANVRSVAEHAIGLIFALAKSFSEADRAVRANDFRFKYRTRLVELDGLTLGIVGLGRIGQQTAQLARALGMRVIAVSLDTPDAVFAEVHAERLDRLDELLAQADVVSLHLPLTAGTRGLIGRRELARMKPGSFLVNTGRGGVVDEAALVAALDNGPLAGAGLDVFESEDMPFDHPLLQRRNALLTPHVAGSTEACLIRTAREVAAEVLAVLRGEHPRFLVNPDVWPRRRGLATSG
jgi:D-3-phosphoglycerate dehydrogenase